MKTLELEPPDSDDITVMICDCGWRKALPTGFDEKELAHDCPLRKDAS